MNAGRPRIFVAIGVVFLIAACVVYSRGAFTGSHSRENVADLRGIKECVGLKNAPQCSRPFVAHMLQRVTGAQVMDALPETVGRKSCHFIGHIVGQESLKKFGEVEASIRQCDRTCESACVHGVIGGAFANKLGYKDDEVDLSHLTKDEIRKVGKELCTANQTCHGVGHAIFQISHDIPQSLALCTDVASQAQRAFCTVGVFMEYADVLEMRSARPGSEVSLPSEQELGTLCTKDLRPWDKRSCFQYLTTIAKAVYGDSDTAVTRVVSICKQQDSLNRSACFFGIGAYLNTYLLEKRAAQAHADCEVFVPFADQASCNFGSIVIDMAIRQPAVFGYCAGIESDPLRLACYQNTFYSLSRREESVSRAKSTYCGEDAVCAKAARDFDTDPWEYIVGMPESQIN